MPDGRVYAPKPGGGRNLSGNKVEFVSIDVLDAYICEYLIKTASEQSGVRAIFRRANWKNSIRQHILDENDQFQVLHAPSNERSMLP